jgi:SAM-dependent methyltransferase
MTDHNPFDLPPEDYELALTKVPRPDLLRQLVDISRRTFGFYALYPYTINYPWAAARLEHLQPGASVLDIAAGLNPLPLFLAERGVFVDCVDHNPITRTPPPGNDWNEWGFFDYGRLHANLAAYHCEITMFRPVRAYDAIYSICAVAHMPRAVRQEVFRLCYGWLRSGGRLLLACDLIPSTDFIWNRCLGNELAPPAEHGTVDDVISSLRAFGFTIDEPQIVRNVPKARTDLLFVRGGRA